MACPRLRSPAAALAVSVALGAAACGGAGAAGAPARPATTADPRPRRAAAPRPGGARPARPARPTGEETTEDAVRRAYQRSWDDYAHAVWALDGHGLERTYARDGLADIEVELDQRVRARRRSRVEVTHDVTVVMLGGSRAAVTDRAVESSFDVDADTGAPLEPRVPRPRTFQMILERVDGTWKVVFSA